MADNENTTVRIVDIARMAGVSVATVDRVIHNRGKVSEENLARINEVLRKVNYRPNLIARSLASGRQYTLAVVMPRFAQGEYWADFDAGIVRAEAEARRYNISVRKFFFDQYDRASFEKLLAELRDEAFDGAVIATLFAEMVTPLRTGARRTRHSLRLRRFEHPGVQPAGLTSARRRSTPGSSPQDCCPTASTRTPTSSWATSSTAATEVRTNAAAARRVSAATSGKKGSGKAPLRRTEARRRGLQPRSARRRAVPQTSRHCRRRNLQLDVLHPGGLSRGTPPHGRSAGGLRRNPPQRADARRGCGDGAHRPAPRGAGATAE